TRYFFIIMLFQVHYIENHELEKIHQLLEHFFEKLANGAAVWDSSLFPTWFEDVFNRPTELDFTTKLREIFDRYKKLLSPKKQAFYEDFINSNKIQDLCNDTTVLVKTFQDLECVECVFTKSTNTPNKKGINVKKYTYNFFIHAYEGILTKENPIATGVLKVNIKDHYQKYVDKNERMCPFCGLYHTKTPKTEGRADYDHYLDKATYPFSAVNLRNLVPMCDTCNKSLKGSKNMIVDNKGERVTAFYPYDPPPELEFKLSCTQSPTFDNKKGKWQVDIMPKTTDPVVEQKISTWKRVFNIANRYAEYVQELLQKWWNNFTSIKDWENEIIRLLENIRDGSHPFQIKSMVGFIPEKIFYEYLFDNDTIVRNLVAAKSSFDKPMYVPTMP
ncbi:MAG: hypothetical protein RLZZ292_1816, partial [Bacteroidota bacterium]